jgi:molybdenum cofactor guanylyltransferase
MSDQVSIAAFLLAGGKSSRMGRDKGLINLAEKPMAKYAIETLEKMGLTPTIVTNNEAYASLGYPMIQDIIPDKGPMGGLYTAMENTQATYVLLVSCDMPFVPKEAFQKLIEAAREQSVIVSEFMGKTNPLFALYHKSLKEQLKENLDLEKLKMLDFISETDFEKVDMEDLVLQSPKRFTNINTPEDLDNTNELWED